MNTKIKPKSARRRIVETAVGAALGAAIAGPAGAVAGGITASGAAARVKNLGERRRARKRRTPDAGDPAAHADIRRILVPLDFSAFALRAAHFARKWAARFRAEICLLHVTEPVNTTVPFAGEAIVLPPRPPGFRREMSASMEKIARRDFRGISKVSVHLREGTAHHEIVIAAKKLKADIIILTTHGRTGLMHALIGSTAERVVRHAPCPVLVLR